MDSDTSFNYKRRGVAPLTNRYLSEEQSQALIAILLNKTPDEVGLEHSLWNSKKIIRHFIGIKFSIHYSERGIRKLISSMGFQVKSPSNRLINKMTTR
ncbi:winged helix-turn-helix domain-containing protein [Legionella gresilensis]|uniref:winged helix-turn-helix domain-containing protein n=1 Tax=Legionella gresilensis TaxID=91823 RepID=UPI00104165E8|nr:winged helix-turn-helix domain-containing protein [Legionella gresilensis]